MIAALVAVSSRAGRLASALPDAARVDDLGAVARLLARRAGERRRTPGPLELIGHSTRDGHLLRLGRALVDPLASPTAAALAAWRAPLAAAGITSVRLLGCSTAIGPVARRILVLLASAWDLPVAGTRRAILAVELGPSGLRPELASALLEEIAPPGGPPRPPAVELLASAPHARRPRSC